MTVVVCCLPLIGIFRPLRCHSLLSRLSGAPLPLVPACWKLLAVSSFHVVQASGTVQPNPELMLPAACVSLQCMSTAKRQKM